MLFLNNFFLKHPNFLIFFFQFLPSIPLSECILSNKGQKHHWDRVKICHNKNQKMILSKKSNSAEFLRGTLIFYWQTDNGFAFKDVKHAFFMHLPISQILK
jgi:hypothetical protein